MYKKIIIILALFLLGVMTVQAKSCKSCCAKVHCSEKEQNRLKKLVQDQQKEINMLRTKTIHLDANLMIDVYDNNNIFIGNIIDEYNAEMIGTNMRIVPRLPFSKNTVYFFTDKNMRGVLTSLLPGRYTSAQISLPIRTISSISIPKNIEVVLYSHDNFTGKSILVTENISNLAHHDFNDQIVSIEIIEKDNSKNAETIGKVFYNTNFNGKSIPLLLGANQIEMYQIRSLQINDGYEIKVYDNFNVIDIIDKNSTDICLKKPKNGIYTFVVSKIAQVEKNATIILYKDIKFSGDKYYVITNNRTDFSNLDFLDGSISSVKIPEGLNLQIFENPDFTGASMYITGDIPNLKNHAFNDRIQSFIVLNATNLPKDQVILYSKPDYNGELVYVPLGRTKCDIDINDFNGFCRHSYGNMRASSIFVPKGYTVILEKNPIFWEDKIYHYTESNVDIRNWVDSAIVSIYVKKI